MKVGCSPWFSSVGICHLSLKCSKFHGMYAVFAPFRAVHEPIGGYLPLLQLVLVQPLGEGFLITVVVYLNL